MESTTLLSHNCVMVSIDASTTSTGYTIWVNAKKIRQQRLDFSAPKYKDDRCNRMRKAIIELLNDVQPQIVVAENPPFKNDPRTFGLLQRLVATIQTWADMNNATFWQFTPGEWHSLVKDEDEKIPRKRNELKAWSMTKTGVNQDDIADSELVGLAYVNLCGHKKSA